MVIRYEEDSAMTAGDGTGAQVGDHSAHGVDQVSVRLKALRQTIAAHAVAAGRAADAVQLIAVSKTNGADRVRAALAAGQRMFGENRVQEAARKFPVLKAEVLDLELRLIGPLQTNKAKDAAALFDVIETLDRPKLAETLADLRDKGHRLPRLLVQVNVGREPQKAGIDPDAAAAFVSDCQRRLGLPVEGLMAIPPVGQDPSPYFRFICTLADALALPVRSIGMSGDFEAAIDAGATHVRLGTAIFGFRADPVYKGA
jgi:pyridoxal phosphate enzyme (YggS family)